MKYLIIIAIISFGVYNFYLKENKGSSPTTSSKSSAGSQVIAQAFKNRQSDLQVKASGKVIKILPDDTKGSKHQRFILKLSTGQTVLIAHNIDLAPRVPSLKNGDTVEFYGEYEWNVKGGVVHWTHHDPGGKHIGGWLKCNGKVYQ